VVEESFLAGAILFAVGPSYPGVRDLLLMLPDAQQTKDVFSARFLEAERMRRSAAELQSLTTSPGPVPPSFAGAVRGGSAPGRRPSKWPPCTYIRKRDGKAPAGTPRGSSHNPRQCWAKLDDEFLAANPGKTAADLPDRHKEWLLKRTGGKASASVPQLTSQQVAVLQQVLSGQASLPNVPSGSSSVGPGFEEGSFLGYLLAHSEEACSAAQGPASNPGPQSQSRQPQSP